MRKLFILFALSALSGELVYAQQNRKEITVEDIWQKGSFRVKSVPGFNAMKNGQHYTQIDYSEKGKQVIAVYDLATGQKQSVLFDNSLTTYKGDTLRFSDYRLSEDEQKMLLLEAPEHIYRRSVLYKTYVYDLKTKNITLIDEQKILHPSFSPDGSKVAFVQENNLFYMDLANGQKVQITRDGERNKIINGNCDWVYEEEFEFTQAYQWSPDGAYIAYYRFDESAVPMFNMTMYDKLYPTPYLYKYPKAGEPNSEVSIQFYSVKNGSIVKADLGPEKDQYIPRIKWTKNNQNLCIYRLNRHQNKLELLSSNALSGKSSLLYHEQNDAYIEINDQLEFLPDQKSFIFSSERNGYNQLYRYFWDNKTLVQLTKGDYDIESIVGIDDAQKLVYYTAAKSSATERKLYAVNWNGTKQNCLTPQDGTHQITPCNGFRYFLDKHSRINQVPVYSLIDQKGKTVRVLENNEALQQKMNEYTMGTIRLCTIEGVSQTLNAWMITPPNFDSSQQYPVLMYQYSGPGSQMVADKFPIGDYFWHQMLASKGYIIFCADGTGTGFRGEKFKKKTYLQLGKYESDDQITVAKNLAKLPFVDKERIGIWGWSYGGFMSSTCILKGNDVFKAAIAVAPVTNWRYYDNIYTERYMRTPQENKEGYDQNAPEKMAKNLKGKFLLVHGTADDNVHFQNAVMLTEQLIQNNKDFENAYYPNKNHGIGGGNSRLHLYRKMTDFILKNL